MHFIPCFHSAFKSYLYLFRLFFHIYLCMLIFLVSFQYHFIPQYTAPCQVLFISPITSLPPSLWSLSKYSGKPGSLHGMLLLQSFLEGMAGAASCSWDAGGNAAPYTSQSLPYQVLTTGSGAIKCHIINVLFSDKSSLIRGKRINHWP